MQTRRAGSPCAHSHLPRKTGGIFWCLLSGIFWMSVGELQAKPLQKFSFKPRARPFPNRKYVLPRHGELRRGASRTRSRGPCPVRCEHTHTPAHALPLPRADLTPAYCGSAGHQASGPPGLLALSVPFVRTETT